MSFDRNSVEQYLRTIKNESAEINDKKKALDSLERIERRLLKNKNQEPLKKFKKAVNETLAEIKTEKELEAGIQRLNRVVSKPIGMEQFERDAKEIKKILNNPLSEEKRSVSAPPRIETESSAQSTAPKAGQDYVALLTKQIADQNEIIIREKSKMKAVMKQYDHDRNKYGKDPKLLNGAKIIKKCKGLIEANALKIKQFEEANKTLENAPKMRRSSR